MAGLCSLSALADQGDAMTANDRNDNLRLCKGISSTGKSSIFITRVS